MNPFFYCTRSARIGGFLLSAVRQRPLAPTRYPGLFARRPTTTTTRLSSALNIPPNGIIVPAPPPLPLSYQASRALSPVVRAFRAYGRAQNRRPYTVQLLTSITIYILGDLNAQLLFGEEDKPYDPIRTLRMIAIGGILSAPSYRWFLFLSSLFSSRFPKPIAVGLRVAVNQIVFTPVFLTCFFSLQSLMSGSTTEETAQYVNQILPTAYKNSCQLWPAVSAVNFYWIKLEYRSIFSGVVAIGWNAYLSFLSQKAAVEENVGMVHEVPVQAPKEQVGQTWSNFGQRIERIVLGVIDGGMALIAPIKSAI